MFILMASYLLLVFVLPVALSLVVTYRGLPTGRACVQCGAGTVGVRAVRYRIASRLLPRAALEPRWCMGCGWEGVVRVARTPRRLPVVSAVRTEVLRRATQTLDVRSVSVDGKPFRVMLQCWDGGRGLCGRLMFIGPSGRLWLDTVESFSGVNETEVLGQAMSLPDGLLLHRLQRLVSQN